MAEAVHPLVVDVVVPARDCSSTLREILAALPGRRIRSVVVVDYGSRDATGQVARDAGAVVLRESRGGYGSACRRAIAHLEALPRTPDVVVFLDPSGNADPAELGRLLPPLESDNAELVLAVPSQRRTRAAGRIAVGLIGLIYRHQFAAIDGFRAIRFPALVALGLSDRGVGWNVEMQVKALRLGLRIAEVEVSARDGDDRPRGGRRELSAAGRAVFRILRHSTAR